MSDSSVLFAVIRFKKMNPLVELNLSSSQIKQIATNIQRLMKHKQMSECDLARSLKVSVMTVRRIVSGETLDPRISTLSLFADFFGVTIDALVRVPSDHYGHGHIQCQPTFVPLFDWEQVEKKHIFEKLDFLKWESWHPISSGGIDKLGHKCIAIETKLTMQPRFPAGTILVVDPDVIPLDGDLVLIRISENQISLRELVIDPPNKVLYPVILGSEPILFDLLKHEFVGVVVLTLMYPRRR